MFPETRQKALVKKEMRVLREVVGNDKDAAALLPVAMGLARERTVVKRWIDAPCLGHQRPWFTIRMRKNRFDVYQKVAYNESSIQKRQEGSGMD